jgi:copper resistance protein B
MKRVRTAVAATLVGVGSWIGLAGAAAQSMTGQASTKVTSLMPGMKMSGMGHYRFAHVLLDQLEGRTNGSAPEFRWDGEGWVGSDMNRLWIKSEGFAANGSVSDGDQELLYDRPIPHLRYFDAQVGVREDLDSGPSRTWAAIGVEGLSPYFLEFAPTLYIGKDGAVAGRINANYELLLTQRLIAEPQAELNFYSTDDRSRQVGSGLSEVDSGLRLRYEFSRKLAPYIGYAFNGKFGDTAGYVRQAGETVDNSSFVFGLRVWY